MHSLAEFITFPLTSITACHIVLSDDTSTANTTLSAPCLAKVHLGLAQLSSTATCTLYRHSTVTPCLTTATSATSPGALTSTTTASSRRGPAGAKQVAA
ncbi:hypothetical protein V8C86DRAFT_623551 [Haematococcus lacustris]